MKLFFYFFLIFFSNNIFCKEINIIKDIPGKGFDVVNHTKVKVHYIGKLENGIEFDNSYKRGEPISFQIGTRQVIKGWEIGLIGMKIGGKRTLVIPPELAYGNRNIGDLIPANSTLIFDVEIIDAILPRYKIIDSKQMILALSGDFKIVDIRTSNEREKTGTIPGAINITAFDIEGNFDPDFLESYNKLIKNDDKVVFVSNKGEISAILANGFVERLGAKNIYSLKDGIQGMIQDNFKLNKIKSPQQ